MKMNQFFSKKQVLNVLLLFCFTLGFALLIHVNASAATSNYQITGLKQIGADTDDVKVSWNGVTGSYIWYEVWFAGPDGNYTQDTNNSVALTHSGALTQIIGDLKSGCTYYVKVRAYAMVYNPYTGGSQKNYGDFSEPLEVITLPQPKYSNSYMGSKQVAATSNTITIKWDAAKGATSYKIEYGLSDGYRSPMKMVETPDASTTFVIKGLSPNTPYNVLIYPVRKNALFEAFDEDNFMALPGIFTLS